MIYNFLISVDLRRKLVHCCISNRLIITQSKLFMSISSVDQRRTVSTMIKVRALFSIVKFVWAQEIRVVVRVHLFSHNRWWNMGNDGWRTRHRFDESLGKSRLLHPILSLGIKSGARLGLCWLPAKCLTAHLIVLKYSWEKAAHIDSSHWVVSVGRLNHLQGNPIGAQQTNTGSITVVAGNDQFSRSPGSSLVTYPTESWLEWSSLKWISDQLLMFFTSHWIYQILECGVCRVCTKDSSSPNSAIIDSKDPRGLILIICYLKLLAAEMLPEYFHWWSWISWSIDT